MPKKRGAGKKYRPKPGPKINSVNNVSIPDSLINDYVKELLEPTKFYEAYLSLPQQSKDLFISSLKKSLFTVAERRGADTRLLFVGEYGDIRGVNLTFSFESLAKNPKKYLSSLPKDYLKQVIQQSDIEREVEREVVTKLLSDVTTNRSHFVTVAGNGNGVNLLESRNIKLANGLVKTVEGGQGLEGISSYKDLSDSAINFVNNAQVFIVRSMGENGFTDKSHYLFAEEAVHAYTGLTSGSGVGKYWNNLKKLGLSTKDTGEMFRDIINSPGVDPEAKKIFTAFLKDPDFALMLNDKSKFSSSSGTKLSLQNVLGLPPTLDSINTDFYTLGTALDGLAGGKVGGNANFLNFVNTELRPNSSNWGFSSPAALDALVKAYSDKGLASWEVGGFKDDIFTLFSKGGGKAFTYADYALFKNMLVDINKSASIARETLRDSIESRLQTLGDSFIESFVDHFNLPPGVTADQYKQKVKERLKRVNNWKSYIHIRSDMEAQEEFFEALGRGDLWKVYFFSSEYNRYLPGFLQDINTKLIKSKFIYYRGGKVSIEDLVTGINYYRDKSLGFIGFSGTERTVDRRLFSVQNRKIFTPADLAIQNNEKLSLALSGGGTLQGNAFAFNDLNNDLTTKRNFFNNNSRVFKTGDLAVSAGQLGFLPDLAESFNHIYNNFNLHLGISGVFTPDFHNLDLFLKDLKMNPSLFDTDPLFMALKAANPAEFNRFKDSLLKFFSFVDSKKIPDTELASLGAVLMNNFTSKGKLMKYVPLLAGLGERLSSLQNYAFAFLGDKILKNTVFKIPKLGKLVEWFWDNTYNPRFGSIKMALQIKNFVMGGRIGMYFARFLSSPFGIALRSMLSKILPTLLTTATAGMAYLAMWVERTGRAILLSVWHVLRGKLDLVLKDYYNIIDDLVTKPVKMIVKITTRLFIAFCLIISLLIGLVVWSYNQSGRPTGGGYYADSGLEIFQDENGDDCVLLSDTNPAIKLDSSNFNKDLISRGLPMTSCPGWRGDFHFGVDFGYPTGTAVLNPFKSDAIVVDMGEDTSGYGNFIKIKKQVNGVDYYFLFAHLDSISVNVGDSVGGGQALGYSDNTGNSTGPHLHVEVRTGAGTISDAENPCTVIDCGCSNLVDFSGAVCYTK